MNLKRPADIQKLLKMIDSIFPDMINDNKLDITELKQLLGNEFIQNESLFELIWPEKDKLSEIINSPTTKRFKVIEEKSININTTKNIFIEGDNLDTLKLLRNDYTEKIKLVYIDPPYNTGKDFVFSDKFKSNHKQNSLFSLANQQNNNDGIKLHTNWLSMIYPRLSLSRDLLKDDGVIMISIDNSEKSHLQVICNEIFGEKNFIGDFVWINRTTPNDAKIKFATDHEFIVMYAKNIEKVIFKGVKKDFAAYKNPDNDKNGDWCADNPSAASGTDSYKFAIVNPFTGQNYFPPKGRYWAFAPRRVEEWTKSGKLVFPKEENKNFVLKKYKKDLRSNYKPITSIINGILTSQGTKEMKALYSDGSPFKYPKPTQLLIKLIEQITDTNDIILDYFAGSASTAHAVMKLNYKTNSNRQFICVQTAEKTKKGSEPDKQGFRNISAIAIDRIHKVAKQYENKLKDGGVKYLKIEK